MYYYRARYYDPVLGRFLSEDPLGASGEDENDYAYSESDPVNSFDPFGLQASKPAPSGGVADEWTYGEIGQFAIPSLKDFRSPKGLADAKASIFAACTRQHSRCNRARGTPTEPGDIAAWNNIVSASGGSDLSGGGELMCVNTQACYFVHTCRTCKHGHSANVAQSSGPLFLSRSTTRMGYGGKSRFRLPSKASAA